jgi:hypothetical protein
MVFAASGQTMPAPSPTTTVEYRSNEIAFDELQVYVRRGETPDLLPGDFDRAYAAVASKRSYSGVAYGLLYKFAYYHNWRRVDDPEFDSTVIVNLRTHLLYYVNNYSKEFVRFSPQSWKVFTASERSGGRLAGFFAPSVKSLHRTVQIHIPPKMIAGTTASGWKESVTETGVWRLLPKLPPQNVTITRSNLVYFSRMLHEPCPGVWYSVDHEYFNEPIDFCDSEGPTPFVLYDREQEFGTPGLAHRFITVTARGHLRALGPQDISLFRVPPGYKNACVNATKSNNVATLFCS